METFVETHFQSFMNLINFVYFVVNIGDHIDVVPVEEGKQRKLA